VFVAPGQGIEGKNMGTKAAKFLWQPDLYVGHIAGQAYALVSEKLQRLDQSVGGHDLSRFGQLFSSPKPKKAEAPNVTDISTQRLWKNFCLQSSLLEGRKKRGQSFTLP
jgi:hypothetical protein